jgi:3-mercaptopyruvate sulfurtransferase SseA
MGVDPQTMVLIYVEKGDFKGPYLVWALDCLGHKRDAVMAARKPAAEGKIGKIGVAFRW